MRAGRVRALRRCVLVCGLAVVATACAGRADDRDLGVIVAGSGGGPPDDLSGELLTAEDLDGTWDTGGPDEVEVSDAEDEVPSPCEQGPGAVVSDHQQSIGAVGNATIALESVDTDARLVQHLYHDPDGEVFAAFRQAFDACVGEEWEQGGDPVENVTLEAVDLGDHGDDAVGYRELWGSGGEYYGQDLLAVVRTEEVLLLLALTEERTDDPMRRELLPGSLAVAVARLEDGEWQSVPDEPLAPPVDEPASVVVEENSFDEWGLVVRGNSGCRFHEQEDMLIAVMEQEELREPAEARGWDLAPNVMWLLEQAFAVHPSVSVSVAIDRVDISLYEETVDGDSTAYGLVDQETAERVAEDLREVLGNRSVCP